MFTATKKLAPSALLLMVTFGILSIGVGLGQLRTLASRPVRHAKSHSAGSGLASADGQTLKKGIFVEENGDLLDSSEDMLVEQRGGRVTTQHFQLPSFLPAVFAPKVVTHLFLSVLNL